jgi:predicted SprT family Zn-dependent metalloprotease
MVLADCQQCVTELRNHARWWLALWGVPSVAESLTIEWSSRLRRSLGRAIPSRCLVRLSPFLLTARRALVLETVCHEVAHLVVPLLHREPCRPHGPEWAQLLSAAGFSPRSRVCLTDDVSSRIPVGTVSTPRHRTSGARLYVHTCPVCHIRRLARRRISRWRCAACVTAGLDGRLTLEIIKARSP